ncbi:MAG: MFS transporter [Acidimicrobiia bacterium]|nr:MFS transporter [Acidimicrobiia bacterium]MDH5237110.1 MFS transporter [Acidimicrobiia bacterium]
MSRRRLAAAVAFFGFVALGLPESVLATAWPDMADDFGRPIGHLQWLLVSYTLGYLLSSAPAGMGVRRYGVRGIAGLGVSLSIVGLGLYAAGPTWGWVVVAGFVLGCGAGQLDTAMNVWATTQGARTMNLLHAAFGIGTTIGPPLTVVAAAATSWRGAYVVLIAFDLALLGAMWLVGPDHHPRHAPPTDRPSARPAPAGATTVILASFAAYVAVEVTAGAWGYSYLREQQGLSAAAAGFGIAGYWAGLTLGRLALGLVGSGLAPQPVLVWGAVGSVAATVLIALGATAGGVIGLIGLGCSLAGLFPALMLLTPAMVGADRAALTVGWSLSASGISSALVAVLVGQQVDRVDLGVIPPNLLVGSLVLLGLVLLLLRLQRTPAQASSSAAPGADNSADASANSIT